MNTKQCKELRRAIIATYPPFQEMERLSHANLTEPEEKMFIDLQKKFKKVYKEAKKQYKATPKDKRKVVIIN